MCSNQVPARFLRLELIRRDWNATYRIGPPKKRETPSKKQQQNAYVWVGEYNVVETAGSNRKGQDETENLASPWDKKKIKIVCVGWLFYNYCLVISEFFSLQNTWFVLISRGVAITLKLCCRTAWHLDVTPFSFYSLERIHASAINSSFL